MASLEFLHVYGDTAHTNDRASCSALRLATRSYAIRFSNWIRRLSAVRQRRMRHKIELSRALRLTTICRECRKSASWPTFVDRVASLRRALTYCSFRRLLSDYCAVCMFCHRVDYHDCSLRTASKSVSTYAHACHQSELRACAGLRVCVRACVLARVR